MPSDTPQRKMKQGRLPFSPVDTKVQKKRKLSCAEDESKSPKLQRPDEVIDASQKKKSGKCSPSVKSKPCDLKGDGSQHKKIKVSEEKENVQKDPLSSPGADDEEKKEAINQCSENPEEDSNDGIQIILVKNKDKLPKESDKIFLPKTSTEDEKHDQNVAVMKKVSGAKGRGRPRKVAHPSKDGGTERNNKPRKDSQKNDAAVTNPPKKRKRKNAPRKQSLGNQSIDQMFKSLSGKQIAKKILSPGTCSTGAKPTIEIMDVLSSDDEATDPLAIPEQSHDDSLKSVAQETCDGVSLTSNSPNSSRSLNSSHSHEGSFSCEGKSKGKRLSSSTSCEGKSKGERLSSSTSCEGKTKGERLSSSTSCEGKSKGERSSSTSCEGKSKRERLSSSTSCEGKSKGEKLSSSTNSPKSPKMSISQMQALLSVKKRKLTPSQRQKQEEMEKRREERIHQQIEKQRLKQEKEEEKQKLKEEKTKKKLEEQEAKEREKEEKRQKREEERLKKEEKKEEEKQKKEEEKQKREEERQKKEEERKKKEEEKQKREEERLLAEQELKQKRKAQFARFFVPKRAEPDTPEKETENASGNFILFQVKDNMRIAPSVRSSLSDQRKEQLEAVLENGSTSPSANYLQEIRNGDYVKGRAWKTFPSLEPEDYCEILSEDDDDEDIDGTDLLQETKAFQPKSKKKVKFLQFCENRRPAYYGTWSKTPASVSGRKPFSKEEVFDYEYDSDDDWEDVENGESLSDSDGEADGEEAGEGEEDYEVDNDFFVPHGYLSDGEGEEREDDDAKRDSDEEEKDSTKKISMDENIQKEKLKKKQEEFELEMKQKTKQLKPKVYGCVWLEDPSSHPAYDQLVKILSSHRATIMFGSCPLDVETTRELTTQEAKDQGDEEEESTKKFVKSFPEKAVADLIRLIHGNRYSKLFLVREFSEYWKRRQCEAPDDDDAVSTGCIAKRKIEPKIQEIAQYGKFSEDGVSLKYRSWFVSKEVRKKYGLENLSLRNTWTYTLTPKEWGKDDAASGKEEKLEEATPSDQQHQQQTPTPKGVNTNLITKFTRVLTEEEERKKLIALSSPKPSSMVGDPSPSAVGTKTPTTPKTDSNFKTPQTPAEVSSSNSATTPLSSSSSKRAKKMKKKIGLIPVSTERDSSASPKANPIISLFNTMGKNKRSGGGGGSQGQSPKMSCSKKSSNEDNDSERECIILE